MQNEKSDIRIGEDYYEKFVYNPTGGSYVLQTSHFAALVDWIKPTEQKFNYQISRNWWERRNGDHGGGHFNEDQYHRYLAVIYG